MAEWTKDQIIARIRGEADQQKVDPDLAVAVALQESYLNPNAVGDNGNSRGLFQLQPAAAIDVGVNPKFRHEPDVNIYGGIQYLKQKLAQSKGNVDEALRRYNGGGDPNYVQNVRRFFKPGVAEASERPQPGTYSDADVQNALTALQGPQETAGGTYTDEDVQNALKALGGMQPSAQAPSPSPPTARSTPEQDAAYRASVGQQAPGSPTRSQAPAEEPVTPERRFLDLPSVRQMPLEDRTQRFQEFSGLRPELKEEFLRSEEPASDLTVDIEKPSTPQPGAVQTPRTDAERQARVREELAAWEQQAGRPWREGDPRMPSEKTLGAPDEAPVEEGITKPSTMLPLVTGGLGMRAATGVLPQVGGWTARGARAAAEGLSQTLGWGTGRTIETGEVPSLGELGTEAAWNVGTGGVIEGLGAARSGAIRRSRGGRAVGQEGQAVIPEAYSQAVEGQRSAIQTARAVPGRYTPETPSWVQYEKFGDAAKDAVVDLTPAKAALAEVRASRGVLPDGTIRPFPSAVESIAANLEKATGATSVQTIRNELRRLGSLTRHADGNIRGPAKQLYGVYADALEASPVANDLLRNANATFRREMALQDVDEWLRPGHGVIRIDNHGREVINVGSLLTRLEKKIGDDTLFARSFGPDDLQALRQDFGRLAGTPAMPRGGPPAPPSAREAIGERPRFLPTVKSVSATGGLEFLATSLGVPPGVVSGVKAATAVGQQARYALAYALTSERLRPMVAAAIRGDGTLNPRVYGLIIAAMTPAEKKALERKTRGER